MPAINFNENDAYAMPTKNKDIYETKEDANEKSNALQRTLRSILNTTNTNHNIMISWQTKVIILGAFIYIVIIISIITSIVLTNLYASQMFTALDKTNEDLTMINEVASDIKIQLNTMSNDSYIEIAESKEIEEEIEPTPEPEITEPVAPVEYNYTDIAQKSGFTAEQFNAIISKAFTDMGKSDTKMTDIGAGLYTAEQEYNVNGLYLLGIASLESGWGTSRLAIKLNNIYGLIGMRFSSVDDCSEYMGKLIRNKYIDKGYDTLNKIQKKYCPNGGSKWVNNIKRCTNKYIAAATELYSSDN